MDVRVWYFGSPRESIRRVQNSKLRFEEIHIVCFHILSFYLGITDLRFVVMAEEFTAFCGFFKGVVLFMIALEGVLFTCLAGLFELILESWS